MQQPTCTRQLQHVGARLSEADAWRAWTPAEEPLYAEGATCSWAQWRYDERTNATMCLYAPGSDHISDQIRSRGHWHDCARLVDVWTRNTTAAPQGTLFVELGGNIGACTVEMLLRLPRTDLAVAVFEPSDLNLFHLTSTLRALALSRPELHVERRAVVFPLAVGNTSADVPMYVARNNHGDSVLGVGVPRQGRLRVAHTATRRSVHVRPLDEVFGRAASSATTTRGAIRLMKLDVQGYECRALDGARRLFSEQTVQAIVTEVSEPHLAAQGCSPAGMLRRLRETFGQVREPTGRRSWSYDVAAIASWRSRGGQHGMR